MAARAMRRPLPATICDAFHRSAQRLSQHTSLMFKGPDKEYQGIPYQRPAHDVDRVMLSLFRLGLRKGDRAGIVSANRPEWAIANLAILKPGGTVVPIYCSSRPSWACNCWSRHCCTCRVPGRTQRRWMGCGFRAADSMWPAAAGSGGRTRLPSTR